MITQKYEHHLELRQYKLCPFKFHTCDDLHTSVCNWHNNIEVILVTDGEGKIQYGAEDLAIKKGDIIIVNSGALHRPYSEKGVSFHYLLVDESFCRENGIDIKNRAFDRIFKSEAVEGLFLDARAYYEKFKREQSQINTAKARFGLLELLIKICEDHTVGQLDKNDSRSSSEGYVKATLEYLGEHFTEQISLENLASACGVTKYHLAREFKRFTGETVFTHINILRCKRAEHCILGGMTVTEAAGESGFESVSYFSRTYKRLIGHSPSKEKGNRS